MAMRYVRDFYRVPAKRGMRVLVDGRSGVITGADHRLHVRFDGDKQTRDAHPTWRVTYLLDGGVVLLTQDAHIPAGTPAGKVLHHTTSTAAA